MNAMADQALMEQVLSPESLSNFHELPPMRQNFVLEYFLDPTNQTEAARKAGSEAPEQFGYTAMADRRVQVILAELMNARVDRTLITADRILQEIAILAFSNVDNYRLNPKTGEVTLKSGVPSYVLRAVQSIKHKVTIHDDMSETHEVELKLWNKTHSINMAMKHLGMLDENINLNVRGSMEHRNVWEIGGRKLEF